MGGYSRGLALAACVASAALASACGDDSGDGPDSGRSLLDTAATQIEIGTPAMASDGRDPEIDDQSSGGVGAPSMGILEGLDAPSQTVRRQLRRGCRGATTATTSSNARRADDTLLCLVNAERRARGLRPLRNNRRLARAARRHSTDMVRQGYFSHRSPQGSDVLARVDTTGYIPRGAGVSLGENLAFGSGQRSQPREIVDAWLASPGHRANMLNRRWVEIGLGLASGTPSRGRAAGGVTITNVFGVVVR